ncbi:hypothetical protein PTT_07834 [Pyrenophora teres f. teres 0-1]|uniref:Uncharacterized protein n=1 Tax=Pyrenophora teres f. teres (strain 0-1) TaxID=861557 RepID=E3RIG8_PYRTT|nr:hypothetical protein PTT_07834 [Pyrenophora teres f. teres 0-1]
MTGKEWQTEQLQIVPQPTKEPTTIATSTSHPPRKTPSSSSYPRPSPPGILYPTPIVPLSVLSSQFAAAVANAITIPYPTPTPMSHSNITPAHLPTNYKFLLVAILTVVVLSAAWSLLVCCMSVPADWWKRGWGGAKKQKKKERRPVDKVSKYGGVKKEKKQQGGQGDGAAEGMEMELQHRPRHRRQRDTTCDGEQACSASTYGSNGTGTVRRRVISSAPATSFPLTATATTTAAQTPSSTLSSPMNPFLDPPIPNPLDQHHEQRVRRTSVEWERERAAFFLSANAMTADAFAGTCASASTSRFMSVPLTPRRSYSRSRSRSPSPSPLHRTDTEALEAMEAGTAPPSPPPPSAGSTADEKSGVLSKSMSLIGEGLLMMDGAVDGFVARMGRWTDDEGGEEALLLLPLSQPKRGGVDA